MLEIKRIGSEIRVRVIYVLNLALFVLTNPNSYLGLLFWKNREIRNELIELKKLPKNW